MNVKTFMKNGFIFCMLPMLCSCIEKNDVYQAAEEEKGGEEYAAQFSNYTEITVNISSANEGMVYSIYFSYPYEDGDLTKEAYLLGKTPISTSLKVPKDVKTLYILGNGKMIESKVIDLSIDDLTSGIRSTTITNEVLVAINETYFPEKANNVKGKELYKCSDLEIAQTESSGPFNEAEIWITYLGDGGFFKAGYGKLWFYTYPSNKMKTLTIKDCTFYGREGMDIKKVDYYLDIQKNEKNENRNGNPIFWSREENDNVNNGTRISLGKFSKGVNVGFVFRGPNERPQFTTPALNISCNEQLFGDHTYIGKTINYEYGKSFLINENVSNGFIYHISIPKASFEGNVLGMENRTPGHRSYDGDYNDMLCLIESNPVAISPSEPIAPPTIDDYTLEKGYYLFEDNYPNQGDFDFNDVVIEYNIITYLNNTNKSKWVYAKLLANGCSFSNEFGFKDDNGYQPFFSGINGFMNVRGTSDETSYKEFSKALVGEEIKPYLNNGKGYIFDTNYNTGNYPYVLDIPYKEEETPFRWCQENVSISDAYRFTAPRAEDWYTTPNDESLVIQRSQN